MKSTKLTPLFLSIFMIVLMTACSSNPTVKGQKALYIKTHPKKVRLVKRPTSNANLLSKIVMTGVIIYGISKIHNAIEIIDIAGNLLLKNKEIEKGK